MPGACGGAGGTNQVTHWDHAGAQCRLHLLVPVLVVLVVLVVVLLLVVVVVVRERRPVTPTLTSSPPPHPLLLPGAAHRICQRW